MGFELTNFTVSILILLGWGAFVIYSRVTGPPEINLPLIFWTTIALISMKWPETTWKFNYIAPGLIFCLLLRFEFINKTFAKVFRFCELVAFGYYYYAGVRLLYT